MKKHWVKVFVSCLLDSLLFSGAFIAAIMLIHDEEARDYFPKIWSGVLVGSISIACACYTAGMYARQHLHFRTATREVLNVIMVVTLCHGLSVLLLVIQFYINFSTRIGRGTMLMGATLAWLLLVLHHLYLRRAWGLGTAEKIALVVTGRNDEIEAGLLRTLNPRYFQVAGFFHTPLYSSTLRMPLLGTTEVMADVCEEEGIDRVICTDGGLNVESLRRQICLLRYKGVSVLSLLQLCEEEYQCTPIALVTPQWLLSASEAPQVQYIRKIKRGFDIACSLAGLLFLSPLLALAMLAVRLTSRGPVIYRQERVGRFGHRFQLLKLRTMCENAESDGAVWCRSNDSRVTPVGRFLRKYRIDEIPQLVNVLRGEMSFVGPRPERPEFVDMLANEIPFFGERLMIHPGVTGWAQVNFPYGSSVADARRKLEYDLYYLKHMGLFLDLFILLDTVRTVIRGTLWQSQKQDVSAMLGPIEPEVLEKVAVDSIE